MLDKATAALVSIDFIRDIVDPQGKLAGKGYAAFVREHLTLDAVSTCQRKFRAAGAMVIHVRVSFSAGYVELPRLSPLFGKAEQFGALQLGSPGTEFADEIRPIGDEIVLNKHRVSAFFGTPLDSILRVHGIKTVVVVGVATDLAVQAAARDAHDRDYSVLVVSDGCAAGSLEDHERSLETLKKIAQVVPSAAIDL